MSDPQPLKSVLGAYRRITTDDGNVLDLLAPVVEALAEILEAAADGDQALVLRSTRT